MRPLDFIRKNKKALPALAGLILVGVSVALLAWTIGKDEVDQKIESAGAFVAEAQVEPTAEPKPTEEPKTTAEPETTEESKTTAEPETTEESETTEEPEPVLTEEYELVYEGIDIFNFASHYTYLKYNDTYADLYMRRQQDDTGEYIELSLWSEQKEIWHTINSDDVEECHPFWREDSGHLTLEQGQSYYVVELEGTAYLMRYCVENTSNMVTMSYKVFGISPIDIPGFNGSEGSYDAGSISIYFATDSAIDSAISFPIEQMTAFADTVKGYMENGHMVASTLHGVFEVDVSADRENPISPYLYDIFPWIPELITQHGINMEGIDSPERLLTALQKVLPVSTSVTMPDVAADGSYFITGDYYSDRDESYLTVRMKEDGSYEGNILIDNALIAGFVGYYDNAVLTVTEVIDYPDELPCEMEISFKNGKATVTITATSEWSYPVGVGDTFILDRNEKPEEFEYLRNAESIAMRR